MKKTLLFLSIVGALASCKKDKTSDTTTTAANSITITGKAFANSDLSNTIFEQAPSGTKITAIVPLNDLRLQADTNLNNRYASFVGTVGTDGTYKISIGAPVKLVQVTLVYDDFALDQNQPTGASPSSVRTTFKHNSQVMFIYGGTTKVDDAYWYF